MKKALITGITGQDGSYLAELLLEKGYEVHGIIRRSSTFNTSRIDHLYKDPHEKQNNLHLHYGDITDGVGMTNLIREIQPKEIYNLAAQSHVKVSFEMPDYTAQVDALGTIRILEAIRAADSDIKFYQASTSELFGSTPPPQSEVSVFAPRSPYAAAKLAGEYYCQSYFHSFGLETVGIRYFNVFGPRQDPNSPYSAVIPLFVSRILSGQSPSIYGDGLQSRDFTYVANVVRGNLLASQAPGVGGRVFNVADGRQTTLLQLLELLAKLLGKEISPTFLPPRVGDVRESLADVTQARKCLGYEPVVGLEEGIRRTIDYSRQIVS